MVVKRFNRAEIQNIVRDIIGDDIIVAPIGNHELRRHQVYCIHNADEKFVFKYYYQDTFADREISSLKILGETDFPCPKIVSHGVFGDDREWLLMNYVNGMPLNKVINKIPRDNLLEIYKHMGTFMKQLHNYKDFDFFGDFDQELNPIHDFQSLREAFLHSAERVLFLIQSRDLPEKELLQQGLSYINKNLHLLDEVKYGHLCHQDFNTRNILVARHNGTWEISAVIDFEHCRVWDREYDFCGLYIQDFYEDPEAEDAFFDGYYDDFEKDAHFKEKFDFYIIYNCLSICSWASETAPKYFEKAVEILRSKLK